MVRDPKTLPICLIYGPSSGGKTTLVEKLVEILTQRGLRVATAKGHKNPIEVDVPGKDTWRHRKAGAIETFLVTGDGAYAFMERDLASDPEMIASLCHPSVDFLLVEGFKTHTGRPKIIVSPLLPMVTDPDLIAVVADFDVGEVNLPKFARDDAEGIADLIWREVLKR